MSCAAKKFACGPSFRCHVDVPSSRSKCEIVEPSRRLVNLIVNMAFNHSRRMRGNKSKVQAGFAKLNHSGLKEMLSVRASAARCQLTALLMFVTYSLVVGIVC